MNSTLAKLIPLRSRVASVQASNNTSPEDLFASLRDQFLGQVERLKSEFLDLQDFVH